MGDFAHAHTDDPLGLATAGDIVFAGKTGGVRKNYVEMLSELGVYIAAAAQEITPVEEFQLSYELRSSSLVVPLGSLINTNYVVTGLSAESGSKQRPTVNVNVIKFSAPGKYLAPVTSPGSITIVGGFGLVNKWGATVTRGISSSMTVSMQKPDDRLEETSGDYLAEGYTQYGFKQEVSIEAYDAITTLGTGAKKTASDDGNTSRDGWKIYSVSFFKYLPAA